VTQVTALFPFVSEKENFCQFLVPMPRVLLAQLKAALQAKVIPQGVKRASTVPFEYIVLARETPRERNGSLGDQKTGNWTALKLFFGDGEFEVFMNLNSVIRKGEFTIKDPDYGDGVLAELAKVL